MTQPSAHPALKLPIGAFRPIAILANGARLALAGRMAARAEAGGMRYDFEAVNASGRRVTVRRIRLFSLSLGTASAEVFRQGFYMPSDAAGFTVLRSGEKAPAPGPWPRDGYGAHAFVAHSLAVVKRPGRAALLTAGFVSFDRFEGLLVFDTRQDPLRLSAWCDAENLDLEPGAVCRLDAVWLREHREFNEGLSVYADTVRARHGARVPARTVAGWVDWQYYRLRKSEPIVMQSVRALRRLKRAGYPFTHVIIDGGWCDHASEWMKPSASFPDIRRLCRAIRRAGFIPGLWLAPYITHVETEVAARHPDWMLLDRKTGRPLFKARSNVGPCRVLDFSVPAALDWLRQIVTTMVREWGVGYLKLDGPCLWHYAGGRLHDPRVTFIEQVHRSLAAIREACGDAVLVEGEGVYGPAVGAVDIQRTSQDTRTAWHDLATGKPLMKENLQNDLLSAFLHGRWWHNHRENVVLRDFPSPFHAGVAARPESKDSILTENQLKSQITAAALSGGAMLLSDPMEALARSPGRLALVSRFLPHYEAAGGALPADVFRGGRAPSIYALPIDRGFDAWTVIGVFNWTDSHQSADVPLGRLAGIDDWHVFEFWTERYLGCRRCASRAAQFRVRDVPAHGCALLAVRRRLDRPQLIGTNLHVLQGAVEIESASYAGRTLTLAVSHFDQAERRLFFWRPPAFRRVRIDTDAADCLLDERRPDRLTLQYNGRRGPSGFRRTTFALRFG